MVEVVVVNAGLADIEVVLDTASEARGEDLAVSGSEQPLLDLDDRKDSPAVAAAAEAVGYRQDGDSSLAPEPTGLAEEEYLHAVLG